MYHYDLKHYPEVYQEKLENFPKLLERLSDKEKDRIGGETGSFINENRFFAVMDYLMKGDISGFRAKLVEAARLELTRIKRFEAGEPIDPSYVSMMNYQDLFNALASDDMMLARDLSEAIGGRAALEKQYDHPFTIAFGYLLKAFVEDAGENEKRYRIEEFRKYDKPNYEGYTMMFEAMMGEDETKGNAALKAITKGHKKESKGAGMFAGSVDQFLSVWGIGMAKLAHRDGLMVDIDDPLIPHELIM